MFQGSGRNGAEYGKHSIVLAKVPVPVIRSLSKNIMLMRIMINYPVNEGELNKGWLNFFLIVIWLGKLIIIRSAVIRFVIAWCIWSLNISMMMVLAVILAKLLKLFNLLWVQIVYLTYWSWSPTSPLTMCTHVRSEFHGKRDKFSSLSADNFVCGILQIEVFT